MLQADDQCLKEKEEHKNGRGQIQGIFTAYLAHETRVACILPQREELSSGSGD